MRFANHPPILEANKKIKVYKLNANKGFESFSTQVHNIVRDEGLDVFYVFDCLSDLLMAWATDLMIGNFFVITCPYLFELNTVAYFAIYAAATPSRPLPEFEKPRRFFWMSIQ